MRVVQWLRRVRLEHGGVVRAVLDLCAHLARAGHEVELLCCDDADVPRTWRDGAGLAPTVVRLDSPALPGRAFSPRQLRTIRTHVEGADVVHLHGVWHLSNVQIAGLCREAGRPYVVGIHGMLDDWSMAQRAARKRLFLAIFGRRMLEGAARVLCTAPAELEQSRAWYPRGRGIVIPPVFDLGPFTQLPGPDLACEGFPALRGKGPHVLFLSRLHPKKGADRLIRAMAVLRDRGVPASLLIAGSGDGAYERQLRDLVRTLSLGDAVSFLGMVVGMEKVSLYQAADVLVLPASQENFGFVIFESMAAGTPVVTTRSVDTWPDVAASGGGAIVGPSEEEIADGVMSLLADEGRRRATGAAGRGWVLRELDPHRVVERMVGIYREARSG